MSWIEKLHQTYENCMQDAAKLTGKEHQLLPICHTTQNAQIRVILDDEGNFYRAETIDKKKASTITPCTEKSGSRSGKKPVNHPLFDKLQYLAGDFVDYGGEVTVGFAKDPYEPIASHLNDLKKWCDSPFSHPKVSAVLKYLKKGTLVADLVKAGVLYAGEDGRLLNTWDKEDDKPEIFKLLPGGTDSKGKKKIWQADAFVIFSVDIPDDPQSNLFEDESVWQSWINYYASLKSKQGLCFVEGETAFLADTHPAKIRNAGDKAKLISANDSSGFTYRGRFASDEEACTIGFNVSQKAHNALRWLIAKQGFRDGDLAIVAWAVSAEEIPPPLNDTSQMFGNAPPELKEAKDSYTAEHIGIALRKLIAGYTKKLGDAKDIIVMGVDSATPGRLSVIYYKELSGADFLERILNWHEQGAWPQRHSKEKQFVGVSSPRDIVMAAYGSKVDDKLKKAALKRLLPCIIDSENVPEDIWRSIYHRVCARHGKDWWEWEKTLGIACSIYRYNNKKKGYEMALERDRDSRDYLFGRLLAVADCLEGFALSDAEKGRPTNAVRLMQRFADHPLSTWRTIELQLNPYKIRLGRKIKKYDAALREIMDLFKADDFKIDTSLNGEFLLGYHTQRAELMKSTKKNSDENSTQEVQS